MTGLLDLSLVFVTGKGGVGKSSVAAGFALASARAGRHVLVCEMEPRQALAVAYGVEATAYAPIRIVSGLEAMTMETEAALREYLRINLRVAALAPTKPLADALDFVAAAAPGVRELLTVGKLCWEVRERHYDTVVVDATTSGYIVGNLAAPYAMGELVQLGAIADQARWMREILSDNDQTGVVVATTPEELPVSESIELVERLRAETEIALGGVIVNRVPPGALGRREQEMLAALSPRTVRRGLARSLEVDEAKIGAVLDAAGRAFAASVGGAAYVERLRDAAGADVPFVSVPQFFGLAPGRAVTDAVADALGEELAG